MSWQLGRQIFWAVTFCGLCIAQDDAASRLANQVRADVAILVAHQTLGAWRTSHPAEILKESGYLTKDTPPDETDSVFREAKCTVSIGQISGQVTRKALFYVPEVTAGKLPPLPSRATPTLTRRCELNELRYSIPSPVNMDSVVGALESAWGKPNGQSEQLDLQDSGLWHNVVAWHRLGWNVWIVPNPVDINGQSRQPPMISVRRSGISEGSDSLVELSGLLQPAKTIGEESASSLAKIAALDASLSADVVSRASCATSSSSDNDPSIAAARLERWISAARSLPPARQAAALLLADDYITCMGSLLDQSREPFIALGAKFEGACAQDGGDYGHTFRQEAEKLDPGGVAGAWAQLADLWTYCTMERGAGFVATAEKLLVRFPKWRPYLYYLIGRAHATRLAFAFPGGFPDDGAELAPLSQAEQHKERLAAVMAYRRFLAKKPDEPEAVYVWREAWRLLAGLKPSAVEFGCTCE